MSVTLTITNTKALTLKELLAHVPNSRAAAQALAMENAMQEFVDRVERGEVLSRYTYTKFNEILADLRGDQ